MNLVIDDCKDFGGDIIARNASAGKAVLKALSNVITTTYIDFDLGSNETGADVVEWAIQNNCLPKEVQIISMNPPGRKILEGLLVDAGYQKQVDGHFIQQ